MIIGHFQSAAVQGVHDILYPGNQEPDQSAALVGYGLEDDLGLGAPKQDGTAAGDQRAHPVHLRARMVEGRNAEEGVASGGPVMLLFHDGGMEQGIMGMKDGLGEACGTGGEVNGSVVTVIDDHIRRGAGIVGCLLDHVLCKGRTGGAKIEKKSSLGNGRSDLFDPADEFRTEDQNDGIGKIQAVFDFIG